MMCDKSQVKLIWITSSGFLRFSGSFAVTGVLNVTASMISNLADEANGHCAFCCFNNSLKCRIVAIVELE